MALAEKTSRKHSRHGQLARAYSNLAIAERQSGRRDAATEAERHVQQERDLLASPSL